MTAKVSEEAATALLRPSLDFRGPALPRQLEDLDRIPLGQEHPGGAGQGGATGERTPFIAVEFSDADKGRDFQVLLAERPVCGGLDVYGFVG